MGTVVVDGSPEEMWSLTSWLRDTYLPRSAVDIAFNFRCRPGGRSIPSPAAGGAELELSAEVV